MDKRKKKLIDKQFQLRVTLYIVGIVFVLIGIIITIIGTNFLFTNQKLSAIVADNKEIIVSQNNIIKSFKLHTQQKKSKEDSASNKVITENKKTISTINNNISILNKIVSYNNIVLIFLLAFLIILIYLLYNLLIRNTHRISGPIFVMSEYIQDIINGKHPDLRPIREKDELREFYELFSKMVKILQERDKD